LGDEDVIAGRLRECLKLLRWEAGDLAAELGRPQAEIVAWLDGRSPCPLGVAAWLEALVKAHMKLPAPGRASQARQPAGIGPERSGASAPASSSAPYGPDPLHALRNLRRQMRPAAQDL
jgi:hypothetical protein